MNDVRRSAPRGIPRLARLACATLACAGALLAPRGARAQVVEIKLGTLAPKGSAWENSLKELGQKWSEVSGGKVKLRVYGGGVLGNEGDMVRKMRVGQLHAAALTTVGMHDITPEPQAVDVPLGVESFDELDYVMQKLQPALDAAIEKKGYVVLTWSDVGFVQFFSTRAYPTPAAMASAKIFAWEGDPASVDAWKAGGFQPVVLSATDIVPSLQTGMIDTVAIAPLYALSARIYQKANRMLDLRWAVVNGATVVKKEIWERVPADLRPKLIEIARAYGRQIQLSVRKMNDEAVQTMKAQGLEVVKAQDLPGWRAAAARANKIVRGSVVPAAMFDEVMRVRDEYRRSHGQSSDK